MVCFRELRRAGCRATFVGILLGRDGTRACIVPCSWCRACVGSCADTLAVMDILVQCLVKNDVCGGSAHHVSVTSNAAAVVQVFYPHALFAWKSGHYFFVPLLAVLFGVFADEYKFGFFSRCPPLALDFFSTGSEASGSHLFGAWVS